MLKITLRETEREQRWVLQGRMTDLTVGELVSSWRASREHPSAQHIVVELDDITSIDRDGEQALLMMIRDGAEFIATGLYTKHLVESLRSVSAGKSLY